MLPSHLRSSSGWLLAYTEDVCTILSSLIDKATYSCEAETDMPVLTVTENDDPTAFESLYVRIGVVKGGLLELAISQNGRKVTKTLSSHSEPKDVAKILAYLL